MFKLRYLSSWIQNAKQLNQVNKFLLINHLNVEQNLTRHFAFCSSNIFNSNKVLKNFDYSNVREYSVKKSKGGNSKVSKPKVEVRKEEIDQFVNSDEIVKGMTDAINYLKKEYLENLNVRLLPSTIEEITVKTPEGSMKLGEIVQVEAKGSNTFVIDLINAPEYVKPINDSLIKSALNLNPQIDKTTIYLNIPKVTREHRENMAKSAKLKCEQALKRMREIENKALRTIKEAKRANKDQQYNVSEHIKYLFELHSNQANQLKEAKIKEILQ